ncbi:MAG: nucleoside kinase [Acidobacteria bacterium]|nr:nucleoside kinase [Acidobacteriota bacterium]
MNETFQLSNSHVEVRYRGETHEIPTGTRVDDFLQVADGEIDDTVLAAMVNRRLVMLDFPLRGRVDLELVRYGSRAGELVYKRSVSLMLCEACLELYPKAQLVIGQSLGNCYHYEVRGHHPPFSDMATALEKNMRELVAARRPFVRETVTIEEIEDFFRRRGCEDKLALLATRRSSTVHTIRCGRFVDLAHSPFAPHTGSLPTFAVKAYGDGLLLRFPRRVNRDRLPAFRPRKKLYATYVETREWQALLSVRHVGDLNLLALNGKIKELIHISEGLHEKKIAAIADRISDGVHRGLKLVTIAGPSSSGKTTFSKRLSVQLRVNGLEPIALSLDDYYVDREATPVDQDGKHDFENIEAIDLALFHEQLTELLDGREVRTPKYDFVSGTRKPESKWTPMRLKEGQVLVIEGIHGLNPRLTEVVADDQKFRIYASALSQLAIDDHNRIFTSDARLIRRIVRDRFFRGFSAERTLELWEKVRRGEGRWIFPFQEEADIMFNSALVYEPAVLKTYAQRFLLQVPRNSAAYPEAYRLLKFLDLFVPIFPDEVPHTSILREFIGGSGFEY